ncbi:hypothetical protein PSHT_02004 [Puccinia striiformis]|uniref:DDE Tnp4 domain-containing protein n=1 Tax=Puccinia striiformis TaxID=27350 RepID=A0A2S4WJ30_9BASI|nr:hypothetical protein PSHT_02004 [Puccinia striiformis]
MRLHLYKRRHMREVVAWLYSCIVLHNMLAQLGDQWQELEAEDQNLGGVDSSPDRPRRGVPAMLRSANVLSMLVWHIIMRKVYFLHSSVAMNVKCLHCFMVVQHERSAQNTPL